MGPPLPDADESMTVDLRTEAREGAAGAVFAQNSASSIAIGRVLRDRYVLVARLGSGGMGSVFKALDRYRVHLPEAQQYVAIKILHAAAVGRDAQLANLRREFYCAQMLSHRNIVNVFELDRDSDLDFFTMELLEGERLSRVISRLQPSPMSRPQAWAIIRKIGSGLEYAHAHNVVHADLKPHNIMITDCGDVRILDFGASSDLSLRKPPDQQRQVNSFSSVTPAYASCELLEGRAPVPCDDIYAFACVAYELLAGAHPFQRRRATEARDFAIVPKRPPGLSGRQWRALKMGLSWHRGGRTISLHAWLKKLNARRTGPLPRARELESAPARSAPTSLFKAAALCAALLMGVVVWMSVSGRKISSNTIVSAAAADPQPTIGSAPAESSLQAPPQSTETQQTAADEPRRSANRRASSAALTQPPVVSEGKYTVRSGEHFAEIRVHRAGRSDGNTRFVWWTEAASAKPGVDYVPQGKAVQYIPRGKSATSFFVKLMPTALRTQPEMFYIAIAAAGRGASGEIERTAVWLPTNKDQS